MYGDEVSRHRTHEARAAGARWAASRGLAGGVAAAIAIASAGDASADSPRDPAAAEALYASGRDLVAAGDWAAGCPKFEASLALDPAASTMLNLARCHEHDGKLALAWADLKRAQVLNRETQGEERRRTLDDVAARHLAAIEPRLPRLRLVVRRPPAGLVVRRDGQEMPAATLGEAIPADPGPHVVEATAPGHRPARHAIRLEEGKTLEVAIDLAPGATAEAAAPLPASRRRVPTWAWIVGGAGLGFVGAGVALRVDGRSAERALGDHCGPDRLCDPVGGYDPAADNARKNRDFTAAVVLWAVGGAAVAAGVAGAVVGTAAPPTAPRATGATWQAAPWASPTGGGAAIGGRF